MRESDCGLTRRLIFFCHLRQQRDQFRAPITQKSVGQLLGNGSKTISKEIYVSFFEAVLCTDIGPGFYIVGCDSHQRYVDEAGSGLVALLPGRKSAPSSRDAIETHRRELRSPAFWYAQSLIVPTMPEVPVLANDGQRCGL